MLRGVQKGGGLWGKIFFSSLFIHQLRSGEVMLCQILGSPAWLGYRKYRLCNVSTPAEVRLKKINYPRPRFFQIFCLSLDFFLHFTLSIFFYVYYSVFFLLVFTSKHGWQYPLKRSSEIRRYNKPI